MKSIVILVLVLVVGWNENNAIAFKLPGPRVYVVTPSSRPLQVDEGRSVPFYYHNWMRRMDNDISAQNTTTSTTQAAPKFKTPDLIFAEFESDSNDAMKKSIRKLLEKERIVPETMSTTPITTTTTFRPIYVPDEEFQKVTRVVNYGLPTNYAPEDKEETKPRDTIDYFSMYNKLYENSPPPVFLPSTTQLSTITTTIPDSSKIENIWHIIDSEKNNDYSGTWNEVPVETDQESSNVEHKITPDEDKITQHNIDEDEVNDENAFPGLGTNPGNGGENESRAIRTDQNIRFPYVNLKTFQLKPNRKPVDKKKYLMTSLDNFHDLKNPVRGEAHDIRPTNTLIDRYNSGQPFFPPKDKVSKVSKQNPLSPPPKATANLVPPPPPPVPKLTNNDFPIPTSYESFPPYDIPSFGAARPPAPPPPAQKPSMSISRPAIESSDDFDSDSISDIAPSTNVGYPYRPHSPSVQQFRPTPPSVSKPFHGYSYDKPPIENESPMMSSMDDKPDFQGYHYSKPESAPPANDHMPASYGHHPSPSYGDDLPDLTFQKPHDDTDMSMGSDDMKGMDKPPVVDTKPFDHDQPPSYGHHDASPSYGHDYPELIFQKHHDMDDSNGSDDMKGMAPPPPADMKPFDHGSPMNDHDFPNDFPGDFKYHHDFDDHDFHHHHHHHTTTTTTEMPRVNRYSYYYLGKKLYYLPLYFSVYFIVYVGALVIKAIFRHKIVYPNSWRPNDMTASFFSKRSVDDYLSNDNLHEVTGKVTHAIATAAEKYLNQGRPKIP